MNEKWFKFTKQITLGHTHIVNMPFCLYQDICAMQHDDLSIQS